MYVRIRSIDCNKRNEDTFLNGISKMTKIEQLIQKIKVEFRIDTEKEILLYYKGKQLNETEIIMDYDIRHNDVITFTLKSAKELPKLKEIKNVNVEGTKKLMEKQIVDARSLYYEVNDFVDVRSDEDGAWYEGRIIKIFMKAEGNKQTDKYEIDLIFRVKSEEHVHVVPFEIDANFGDLRPRSSGFYKISELSIGMMVLANYNIEDPNSRGLWFDFKINEVSRTSVKGTVLLGKEKTPIENCALKFISEIMKIENPVLLIEKDENRPIPPQRKYPLHCQTCKDVKTKKCKECGCRICSGKENIDKIILCDECDYGFHIECLRPPLECVPEEEEWYCPDCKTDDSEIVKAGEKLKRSKKRSNMPSKENESKRDWGRGFACAGRTTECTIVPKFHLGAVPSIDVGTCWKFRLQVSEVGIHRPPVAGIHGRETDAAYSIVLSGGYEDDVDYGHEFYYTGSGGRDLSGNKRVSIQSCDQTLTRMNKALALNCNAPFNDKDGAEAKDWRAGKPVRVVRNYKLGKFSKFAPKDGNRYDGLYKVVKYYPEKGKSGFLVWRYLLRRDDPAPAPWDKNGRVFDMIYPEGYLEAEAQATPKKTSKRKTILKDFSNSPKKTKQAFKLDAKIKNAIADDNVNIKLWSECKKSLEEGRLKFYEKVEDVFKCICCLDLVYVPVTLDCKHNICKSCLKRSFLAEIYACPYCRSNLGKNYKIEINDKLGKTLELLFAGYGIGR